MGLTASLNPGRWLAVAGALAALWGLHWWDKRQAAELVHAEYRIRDEAQAEAAKMDRQVRDRRAREADDGYRKQVARAAADRDHLRAEHERLQQLLAERAAAAGESADPGRADAAAAGEELFGECGRALEELAREAAAVQDRLRGLQGAVEARDRCR